MTNSQIFSAVLRICDSAITRAALETALGTTLARYEPARTASLHYAQIDIPIEEDIWGVIAGWIKTIGPRISTLREEGQIGAVRVDLAVSFTDSQLSHSVVVPSYVAEIVGGYGIDVELSIYAVSEDQ